MGKIHVTDREGGQHEIELSSGENLMEPLRALDAGIEALCGGMCSCATCHVYVDEAWLERLPGRAAEELELLEELDCFRGNSRLSCQIPLTAALDGLRVTIAPEE